MPKKFQFPVMFIRNLAWAIDDAGSVISIEDEPISIDADTLAEAIVEVLKRHPEPVVGNWFISEVEMYEKESKDGTRNVS